MFRGIVLLAMATVAISAAPAGNNPKDVELHDNGKHVGQQKDYFGEMSAAPSNGFSPIPSDFSSPAPIDSSPFSPSPIDATTDDPSYNVTSEVSSPNPSIPADPVSDASPISAEGSSATPLTIA